MRTKALVAAALLSFSKVKIEMKTSAKITKALVTIITSVWIGLPKEIAMLKIRLRMSLIRKVL